MTASAVRPSVRWTTAWLGGAALLAAALFAPLITGGYCADSSVPGRSICGSWQQSLVGIETSFWIWLGATAAFGIIAWIASHAFWNPREAKDSAEQ